MIIKKLYIRLLTRNDYSTYNYKTKAWEKRSTQGAQNTIAQRVDCIVSFMNTWYKTMGQENMWDKFFLEYAVRSEERLDQLQKKL